ncbi:MAG: hypothetical protein ACQGVK_12290 [Myxococcota bacterium]
MRSCRSGLLLALLLAAVFAVGCAMPTKPYRSQAVISAHYAEADRSVYAARQCLREELMTQLVLNRGQRVLQRQNALAASAAHLDPKAADELPSRLRFRMLFEDQPSADPDHPGNAVVLVSFDHASPAVAARVTNAVARAWLNVSKFEGLLGVESCLDPIRIDHQAVALGLAGL